MERNREGRRTSNNMAAPANGLLSARRRHRSSSLRDSPDEEGAVEMHESGRLRDRNVVKKDRDRDREREREREQASRSKRRRENRLMIHQGGINNNNINSNNRDEGDDSSEESVNDEEDEEEDAGNGGGLQMRILPPLMPNPSTSAAANHSHNHNNSSYSQQQQIHHRKSSFPSSGSNNNNNKVFRASGGVPPPPWKVSEEVIGVSVPKKARSASTKRSHEWISGGSFIGGGGTEQIHRQSSTSPSRLASSAASPAPMAPPSPSSSNASVRKKMKANGGSKPRPPKSSSKSSSSNPEELEIEIAEVLYGLMTQSQVPSKKETQSNDGNKSSNENKSPVSNSTGLPQNSSSLSAVAPKRKRPRQVSENQNPNPNPFGVRNSPVSSSLKTEIDHQHHQSPKTEISSSCLENSGSAAAENGVSSFGFTTLSASSAPLPPAEKEEEGKCGVGVVLTKEEADKESQAAGLNDGNNNSEAVITTAATTTTDLKPANQETKSQKEEKFEIDLMAPPPQQRTSQENHGDVDFSSHKHMATQPSSVMTKTKEDDILRTGKDEAMVLTEEQKKSKSGSTQETGESLKQAVNEEMNLKLHNDLEKPNKDSTGMNRSLHQALKHQQLSTKSEEKTAQPSSLPVPMSVANWPPMGYVAPLQGVISMDGSTMSSSPIQPLFTQPRPKRCATHCYIARNIHYLQQFMKMNPFWPAASGPAAPMFGGKHPNGMPSTELHANITQSMQDKGQPVGIFPGLTVGKDPKSAPPTPISDPANRKQQVLLQQAMPPVTPNNLLHGPTFIFPFNQQQAVAASASIRPGSAKLSSSTTTGGLGAASGAANSAAVSSSNIAAAAPTLSFSYPNMSANETQYLAIMQNHPYAFPIPAVGAAPQNYRGNHPHAQAMPVFNAPFYSSQMIHPSQIQQPPQQATQSQQTHQNSSGSTSSSQKHLQAQQRQDGGSAVAAIAKGGGSGNGGGLHNSYSAGHKSRPQQLPQHMNPLAHNEGTGGEDSPSTADSRVSRAATNTMSVYGNNFAMPVHSQNFAMMYPQAGSANSNDKKQQQSQQQMLKKVGVESSSLPPQTLAMSFAPMNGAMAQNHAVFQSMPESLRQSYQHMMTSPAAAASAHHSEQKKDFRVSEEVTRIPGHESSNADEDRKGSAGLTAKSGQSIAFSRPDLATDAGSSAAVISGTSVIDSSSSRNINLGSSNQSTRSPISTSVASTVQSSHPLHGKFQQQQSMNAQTKSSPLSNGHAYPEHLITSSSSMVGKFPNSLSSFPLQTSNTSSTPIQSPQWRNSVRGPNTSQVPSSLAPTTSSALKYHHQTQQQQSSRPHPQSHTQISFGSQKLQSTSTQKQQQQQNQNSSSNSGNQCSSPPMLVGSPTASSQPKNTLVGTQRSSPSVLGNPNSISNKSQPQQQQQAPPQLQKQTLQQQQYQLQQHHAKIFKQMLHTQHYMGQSPQAQQHSSGSTAGSGYYVPRKQQQSSQQQSSSSTATLSLSPPVTLANTTTSDPAKAIAAATSNLKGGVGLAAPSSIPAGFPQYVQNTTAAAAAAAVVQVKPAEQKQPAA